VFKYMIQKNNVYMLIVFSPATVWSPQFEKHCYRKLNWFVILKILSKTVSVYCSIKSCCYCSSLRQAYVVREATQSVGIKLKP